MKFKFIAYWSSDYDIYKFVNDIWNINGEHELTYGNDYTHLVVFNRGNIPNTISKNNVFGFVMEPYWSPNYDKTLPEKCNQVFYFQPEKINYTNVSFSLPPLTHRLYDCRYHGELIFKENTTKTIIEQKFEKTKKLSIIINNHPDFKEKKKEDSLIMYQERDQLVRKLIESDLDFDMYGQDWNITDKRYKGFLTNKLYGIKDYKYSIALENSYLSAWITEKIIDVILCGTIPIYNGHPDIFKYYPNCCEYLDFDGNEIERIREIINSDKAVTDYDLENAKKMFLNTYNPINIVKKYLNI